MRNVCIVFVFLFTTQSVFGEEGDRKSYIDSLNTSSWALINSDSQEAYRRASLAFSLAKKINYEEGMALAYNRLGKIHFTKGNFDSALFYYRLNLGLRFKEKKMLGLGSTFINIGDVYLRKGDLVNALKYYRFSGQLFGTIKDTSHLIISNLKIGTLFLEQSKYDEAKTVFELALRLAQGEDYERELAHACMEMGNLFSLINNYTKAIDYYNKAGNLFYKWNDSENLAIIYNSLGNLYYHFSYYANALKYYKKSRLYYKAKSDIAKEMVLIFNIGTVLHEQHRCKESIPYLESALYHARQTDMHLTQKVLFTLSKAYYELKQYEKAFAYDVQYDSITNVLFNTEKEKQINELEIQYQVKERQQEIKLLKANEELQNKTIEQKIVQRNSWIAGALLLLGIVTVIYIAYRQKKRANDVLTIQKNTIEQQHQEKELLLREIHHRVKNNLQVVSSILSLQSYKIKDKNVSLAMRESRARVEAMSMIHRELYRDERLTHINLPSYLLKLLNQVAKSYGFDEHTLVTQIKIDVEEVDVETAIPLGLIVNEVISNSFKHAFANEPNPMISLTLQRDQQHLVLTIGDNGKGLTEDTDVGSFGMELIRSLTKQLRGSCTIDYSMGAKYTFILYEQKRWNA